MYDCDNMQENMDDFMQILEQNAYQNCIPLKGTFELTARCNFDCKMCYIHLTEEQIRQQGRELTNEEWLEIARQAKEAGMLYLTLTGGEVFVRPGFRQLYEELSKMGFLIQIFSNGYCVDESVMEWLEQMPPYTLRFTLYGASDETYEKVCGVKNGFTRVAHAIDLVKKADIPFYMVSTIVKENKDDFEAMYKFAEEKKVYFRASTAVLKSNRGVERDIDAHRIEYMEAIGTEMKEYPKLKNLLDTCGSYRKGFWITWNGNMQLCSFMSEPKISVTELSFIKSWNKLLTELAKIRMPSACEKCKYSGFCVRCPGMLAAECGSIMQVDEAFCNRAKTLYQAHYKERMN